MAKSKPRLTPVVVKIKLPSGKTTTGTRHKNLVPAPRALTPPAGPASASAPSTKRAAKEADAVASAAWCSAVNDAIDRRISFRVETAPLHQDRWSARVANEFLVEYTSPSGSIHEMTLSAGTRAEAADLDEINQLAFEIHEMSFTVRSEWERSDAGIQYWARRTEEVLGMAAPLTERGWDVHSSAVRSRTRENGVDLKIVANRIEESHIDEAPDYLLTLDLRHPDSDAEMAEFVTHLSRYQVKNGDALIAAVKPR